MSAARSRRGPAVVAVLALAVVAALVLPSRAAGPFSFPHRPHLSASVLAAVAGRAPSDSDCRVCHDYARGEREAHLAGCDMCHIDAAHLERRTTGAYARPAFPHREHLFDGKGAARADVTCFTCHAMRVDADWIEFTVPTSGLGPLGREGRGGGASGERTCADCHAKHEPGGGLVKQDETTGDGKTCAACHAKGAAILPMRYRPAQRAAGARPFAHADHGGAAGDCDACHGAIRTSRTIWDHDPSVGTSGKCATCHVDASGRALVAVSAARTSFERIDFSNFPHEKHAGKPGLETCQACHFPETTPATAAKFPQRAASPEPVGRAQLLDYKACDACHGADGWAKDRKSWHVEGHGTGAWACFKCHQGGASADGKLAIATVQTGRATLGELKFAAHAHPGVTSSGARLADPTQNVGGAARACTDCHLGDAAKLTSRLAGRPFAHDPHLPASPSSDDCLACHTSSATARRSQDLARFDAHAGGAPAPTGAGARAVGCLACHAGATVEELGLDAPLLLRTVPQFDHAGHVRAASLTAGTKGIACTQCHEPGGKFGYTTPAEVLDCRRCHAHEGDAAKVARTGPKSSTGDAGKCLACHEQVRGEESGRLGAPPPERVTRSHLELLAGTQHHDKTGDCAACHARDGAALVPYAERIARAAIPLSIHDDPKFAGQWFNDPAISKPGVDPQGRTCATCHRTEPRGYLRSLSKR